MFTVLASLATRVGTRVWLILGAALAVVILLAGVRRDGRLAERAAMRAKSLQNAETRQDVEAKNMGRSDGAVDQRLSRWNRD